MDRAITFFSLAAIALLLTVSLPAAPVSAQCLCIQPDNGNGTVDLPPSCEYLGTLEITTGLPVGTAIYIDAILFDYINASEVPGGSLGGDVQDYDAVLTMQMSGSGALLGFNRTLFMQVAVQSESAPRTPGDALQEFDHNMIKLDGDLFGDPDFDSISIRAGYGNGLPSPGHTTLTRLGPPGSDFQVDSFFDIEYRIEFQGAPGSVLQGYGGITQDQKIFSICGEQPTQIEPATWGSLKSLYR
jgi:hypothetical protein